MSAVTPTAPPLLLKGFEVELYTGRPDGTVVGCSAEAAAALSGFVTEPDCRNLEYITPPDARYRRQLELLLEPHSTNSMVGSTHFMSLAASRAMSGFLR